MSSTKKEISRKLILGLIIFSVVIIGTFVFFAVKGNAVQIGSNSPPYYAVIGQTITVPIEGVTGTLILLTDSTCGHCTPGSNSVSVTFTSEDNNLGHCQCSVEDYEGTFRDTTITLYSLNASNYLTHAVADSGVTIQDIAAPIDSKDLPTATG